MTAPFCVQQNSFYQPFASLTEEHRENGGTLRSSSVASVVKALDLDRSASNQDIESNLLLASLASAERGKVSTSLLKMALAL